MINISNLAENQVIKDPLLPIDKGYAFKLRANPGRRSIRRASGKIRVRLCVRFSPDPNPLRPGNLPASHYGLERVKKSLLEEETQVLM